MAVLRKGEIFLLLLLLLIFVSFPSRFSFFACCSTPSEHEQGNEHEQEQEQEPGSRDDILTVSDRQEIQLKKLETLIENLTETVSRLESSLSDICSFASVEKEQRKAEKPAQLDYSESDKYSRILSDFETKGKPVVSGREGGITVTKYKPSWSERFQFLSAIRLESEATCINILPYEDYEGSSKYVAVGDERGWVYIFLSNGDVLVEFKTLSDSPITSMLSYMSFWKNESFLVTGHRDGAILVHQVWEAANGEDWHSLSMGKLREIVLPEKSEEDFSVINLEVHNVGRTRYILSSDVSGRIKVFRENGTLYGIATSLSRPLVFLKQRLLFLTENGVGSLDLRSMTVRESECEGLNGSLVKNYVFDSSERSKAYGFTSEGDLIHVVLLGDTTNFKCMVRAKRKSEMDGSLAVQTVKGYLLVISHEKVFVYNVSSPSYNIRLGGPRPLFYATLDEIKTSFINSPVMPESSESRKPLISTDREKLVVLGLGNGYIGIYRSNLPVFKAEFSTVLWSSPVVLCVLFLIGAWQFLGKKREFAPWNPDDPLSATSMTTGVQLGSGSGERSYQDSSRDVRGGALMGGPPRRYASPNRYPAGTNTSFRPSSSDPSFRTAPELKYRGQNLDIAGFQKRRDPLFSNNQVVEDNVD